MRPATRMFSYSSRPWPLCAACRLKASFALSRAARSRHCATRGFQRTTLSTSTIPLYSASDVRALSGFTQASQGLRSRTGKQWRSSRRTNGQLLIAQLSAGDTQSGTYARVYGLRTASRGFATEIVSEATSADRFGAQEAYDGYNARKMDVSRQSGNGDWEEVDARHDDPEYMTTAQLNDDARLLDDLRAAQMGYALESQDEAAEHDDEVDATHRTHPITAANQFGTSPRTILFPQQTFLDPIAAQIAGTSPANLSQAAHRVYGGIGLPYSTSTPALAKTMQQKPIAMDVTQSRMSEIESDAFLAILVPGTYAAVMSALVETRKRLGTAWAEELVHKAERGELRILDAGGAGAGILAVRDLLRAEWERMHEANISASSTTAVAAADGKVEGPSTFPPTGAATVLVASDTLRHRVSKILENTTFIPRLPDYLHTDDAKRRGKFDLVLAPHCLWPLREDYIRRPHVENLWSMLAADGGVLVLLEKGVARGFEVIAGAREMLLKNYIAPSSTRMGAEANAYEEKETPDTPGAEVSRSTQNVELNDENREVGSIIAPCTNHSPCPMYKPQGLIKGRRDICHFSQRYFRIPAQQRVLKARDKNFEDVHFSFLSVQRGRDARADILHDQAAIDAAFAGYGGSDGTSNSHPASLSLPRVILPPLKRRGHVVLDMCTPAGTLERWTVPRSLGRQAYRDARKSSWGDLWALGAKTRARRVPKIKKRSDGSKKADEQDDVVLDEEPRTVRTLTVPTDGGKMRARKLKGVRDKRDKNANGRGRRKARDGDWAE